MKPNTLSDLANQKPLEGFRISERWGIVAEPGYQAVPDVLLFAQCELGLTSAELNVLLNVSAHWWRPKDVVFPRAGTIADRMGAAERTVQRILRSLVAKGFLARGRTKDGRPYYDLSPLREKLEPIAAKRVKERKLLRELSGKEGSSEGAINGQA